RRLMERTPPPPPQRLPLDARLFTPGTTIPPARKPKRQRATRKERQRKPSAPEQERSTKQPSQKRRKHEQPSQEQAPLPAPPADGRPQTKLGRRAMLKRAKTISLKNAHEIGLTFTDADDYCTEQADKHCRRQDIAWDVDEVQAAQRRLRNARNHAARQRLME